MQALFSRLDSADPLLQPLEIPATLLEKQKEQNHQKDQELRANLLLQNKEDPMNEE